MHLVLLDLTTLQVVHAALGISLHDQTVRRRRPLLPLENVEVVVGGMSARVAFGPQRCAEYDQVLGDRGMQKIHGAHSTACIIMDPFFLVR